MKEAVGCFLFFYLTAFDLFLDSSAHSHARHLCTISGSIHVWFETLNSRKNTRHIFSHTSASEAPYQQHIYKTTFWHDLKHSEMSTLIEDGIRAAGSLISISSSLDSAFFSDLGEMLCCHVRVFTVCWQKCHFQKVYLSYPVRAGRR